MLIANEKKHINYYHYSMVSADVVGLPSQDNYLLIRNPYSIYVYSEHFYKAAWYSSLAPSKHLHLPFRTPFVRSIIFLHLECTSLNFCSREPDIAVLYGVINL